MFSKKNLEQTLKRLHNIVTDRGTPLKRWPILTKVYLKNCGTEFNETWYECLVGLVEDVQQKKILSEHYNGFRILPQIGVPP